MWNALLFNAAVMIIAHALVIMCMVRAPSVIMVTKEFAAKGATQGFRCSVAFMDFVHSTCAHAYVA